MSDLHRYLPSDDRASDLVRVDILRAQGEIRYRAELAEPSGSGARAPFFEPQDFAVTDLVRETVTWWLAEVLDTLIAEGGGVEVLTRAREAIEAQRTQRRAEKKGGR
jgi:hypothetical protein